MAVSVRGAFARVEETVLAGMPAARTDLAPAPLPDEIPYNGRNPRPGNLALVLGTGGAKLNIAGNGYAF